MLMLNSILSLDHSVLEMLYAHRDPMMSILLLNMTQLGSVIAVCLIGCVAVIILALHNKKAEIAGLVITLCGTAAASTTIKHIVQRARPDIHHQMYPDTGYSLPSTHTALATALFTFLMHLVFRLTPSTMLRTIAMCLWIIIIAGVAFSRIYLGVHYLSDVMAGILLGAFLAWIGIILEHSLEHMNAR